jgi:hypothetical protein
MRNGLLSHGRGWDRTSDLPRVNGAQMGTGGDERGRLSRYWALRGRRIPHVSPALLTKTHQFDRSLRLFR